MESTPVSGHDAVLVSFSWTSKQGAKGPNDLLLSPKASTGFTAHVLWVPLRKCLLQMHSSDLVMVKAMKYSSLNPLMDKQLSFSLGRVFYSPSLREQAYLGCLCSWGV